MLFTPIIIASFSLLIIGNTGALKHISSPSFFHKPSLDRFRNKESKLFSASTSNEKSNTPWRNAVITPALVAFSLMCSAFSIPTASSAVTVDSPSLQSVSTLVEPGKQQGDVSVYFGVGCFWHVQHEFVKTEEKLLNRHDNELTSLAGYAGGMKTASENDLVCYHNILGVGDYGKKGYGEVVGMSIPENSINDFAQEYFSLFSNGDRPDKVMPRCLS